MEHLDLNPASLPLCITCNNDEFNLQNRKFAPKVKEIEIEVIIECYVCKKCGTPSITSTQMNGFRRSAADAYRELHNIFPKFSLL